MDTPTAPKSQSRKKQREPRRGGGGSSRRGKRRRAITQSEEEHGPESIIPIARTKIIVRKLPPDVPEQIVWQSMQEYVKEETADWKMFCQGKIPTSSNKENTPSRAYIKFKTEEYLNAFNRSYEGHTFQDSKGNIFRVSIEYATNQKCPPADIKPDPLVGTIDDDPEYVAFIETLKKVAEPVKEETTTSLIGGGLSLITSTVAGAPSLEQKVLVTSTPLLEHIRAQKAARSEASSHANKKGSSQQISGAPSSSSKSKKSKSSRREKGKDKEKNSKDKDNSNKEPPTPSILQRKKDASSKTPAVTTETSSSSLIFPPENTTLPPTSPRAAKKRIPLEDKEDKVEKGDVAASTSTPAKGIISIGPLALKGASSKGKGVPGTSTSSSKKAPPKGDKKAAAKLGVDENEIEQPSSSLRRHRNRERSRNFQKEKAGSGASGDGDKNKEKEKNIADGNGTAIASTSNMEISVSSTAPIPTGPKNAGNVGRSGGNSGRGRGGSGRGGRGGRGGGSGGIRNVSQDVKLNNKE